MLSPNAAGAIFINQECLQDELSSGKVYLCQRAAGPMERRPPLPPLITLRGQRRSAAKARRPPLMHTEPRVLKIPGKSHAVGGAGAESGRPTDSARFKTTSEIRVGSG